MVFGVAWSAVAVARDQEALSRPSGSRHVWTSMSESEIHAVMEEQARKKQEDSRKFLEYSSNTRGDLGGHFRC